ncbi:MAG TPA: hypothetical protein PK490_10170 [Prosthecobacter sp.]|nr:hypothetical protein [Prosthecobacter sp.]
MFVPASFDFVALPALSPSRHSFAGPLRLTAADQQRENSSLPFQMLLKPRDLQRGRFLETFAVDAAGGDVFEDMILRRHAAGGDLWRGSGIDGRRRGPDLSSKKRTAKMGLVELGGFFEGAV